MTPPPSRAEPARVTDAEGVLEVPGTRITAAPCDLCQHRHIGDPCGVEEVTYMGDTPVQEFCDCPGALAAVYSLQRQLEQADADRARAQERIAELEAVARKWLPGLVASLEVPDAE